MSVSVRSPQNLIQSAADFRLEQLITEVADGNDESFTHLHKLTFKTLYATAHSVLRSKMDAEEVVGDTLLYLWQNADRYDSTRGPVISWLSVIVRHRAIDVLRKRKDGRSLDDDNSWRHISQIVCGSRTPAGAASSDEEQVLVQQALKRLPDLERRLVELSFFAQLSHREICLVMSMPFGTVKSHIRRTLMKMGASIKLDAITGAFE